ncbi:MAG: class II fumarate hydratase [Luteimonas sp.]
MSGKRRESDALGEVEIDADAGWSAQTQRALTHFAIGDETMPVEWVRALLLLKGACAAVNARQGRLPAAMAQAIQEAVDAVLAGEQGWPFPLSPWQSGSGTQSHMNVNEVLARVAAQRLGGTTRVHPNDHVNLGQSSNDMVPSAMHVAVLTALHERLQPALAALVASLQVQAAAHAMLIKLGRTHLQDAVPLTVGQEVGAWRSALLEAGAAIDANAPALRALAVGGTAVGTGLNTTAGFGAEVCRELARRTGIAWTVAPDRFAALAGHEPLVALHGALKVLAVALMRVANDLRLLASGPRCGLGEWVLPANEPGSSIMPGKVNPTQCEALLMVACQVVGNDLAVTMGAAAGHLQLNTCKPLITVNVLRSIRLLADVIASFEQYTVREMAPDPQRIGQLLHGSLMLVTALTPYVGYDRAAAIAHRAHAGRTTLRDAAIAEGVEAADFDRWTDPTRMIAPLPDPPAAPPFAR